MTIKSINLALALALVATATSTAVQAAPIKEMRNRCFVVMLQAWCPGIDTTESADTKACVRKHWNEMGGYCQHAYSDLKP